MYTLHFKDYFRSFFIWCSKKQMDNFSKVVKLTCLQKFRYITMTK